MIGKVVGLIYFWVALLQIRKQLFLVAVVVVVNLFEICPTLVTFMVVVTDNLIS